jgi:hypothetical protein
LLDESEDAIIDAEQVIGSVINGEPVAAIPDLGEDGEIEETILDEADDLGDLGDGVTIQDMDEVEEIKEEA